MDGSTGRGGPERGEALVPPVTDPEVLQEVRRRRDEPPWRGRDALGIAVVYLVASVPIWLVAPADGPDGLPPPLVDSAVLLAAAVGWLWLVRGRASLRRLLGPRDAGVRWTGTVALALLVGIGWPVLDSALYALLDLLGVAFPPMQEHLSDWLADEAGRGLLVADFVLLTPVAEEVVFRGVLFQGLVGRWGVRVAAGCSALLFGLAHIESAGLDSVFIVVSTTLFGLACAWLLRRRGTLLAPVLAHAVTNAIGTAALLAA